MVSARSGGASRPHARSLREAPRFEDGQMGAPVAPRISGEPRLAANGIEHLRRTPAHFPGHLRQQQCPAAVTLDDDPMASGLETLRVRERNGRLKHGNLDLDAGQFGRGNRRETRVVEGGGDSSIAHVEPERDFEPHQPDASAQIAATAERDECGRRLD